MSGPESPLFSIITPTVQRDSLIKCCESVDEQTIRDRVQHIVMVDCEQWNLSLIAKIQHPLRIIVKCDHPHKNGGNTCRHNAWEFSSSVWVYHLDDDNFLASPVVLEEISNAIKGIEEQWAIFPIARHGSVFYFDPPQPCYFDTGNAVVRREIARWPKIDDYCSDAVWLSDTLLKHPYKAFPSANPIMVMPVSSFGAGGGINGA